MEASIAHGPRDRGHRRCQRLGLVVIFALKMDCISLSFAPDTVRLVSEICPVSTIDATYHVRWSNLS